ncbi:MAG TPA: HAD family hydrolase [Propionibacteriaceae bacterium]|nr:HAD family hydrolase [Propionibacteriaceae bacterium]
MRPSLIATDLDGTFLVSHHEAHPRNVESVLRASSEGVPIVIATGRPARWLDALEPIRSARPHVVTSNGAVILDFASGEVEHFWALDDDVMLAVANDLRIAVPGVAFALERPLGWACEPTFERPGIAADIEVEVASMEALVGTPTVKLLVTHPDLGTIDLAELVAPIVGDRLTVTWSYISPAGLLEVSAPGISKASALAKIASDLGVDLSRAIAFGDAPNDVEMLRCVGGGHVMANAHPSLFDLGFPVIGSNLEGAVGHTIHGLLDAARSPGGRGTRAPRERVG